MSKADNTRLTILKTAFDLVYAQGYQLTSVDDIIAKTHATKGAFYYHFKNKDTMGLAMVKDVMYPRMHQALIEPLLKGTDPIEEIYQMMKGLLLHNGFFQIKYGCPAVNLIEEMAPVSKQFHKVLLSLVEEWREAIVSALEKGRKNGYINAQANPAQVASFVTVGYSGIRNMGKLYGESCYTSYLKE